MKFVGFKEAQMVIRHPSSSKEGVQKIITRWLKKPQIPKEILKILSSKKVFRFRGIVYEGRCVLLKNSNFRVFWVFDMTGVCSNCFS